MADGAPDNRNPYELGGFPKGLNTRARRTQLGPDELYSAINVDITDAATVASRPGYRKISDGDVTSMWADAERCFAVMDGILCEVDESFGITTLYDFGAPTTARFWSENGTTYVATSGFTGQIVSRTVSSLGLSRPAAPFYLSPGASGGLYPGQYGVAYSYLGDDGQEGGLCEPQYLELTAGGSITVTGLVDTGTRLNLYATSANGGTFYRLATLNPGTTGFIINAIHSGIVAQNIGVYPAPIGAKDLCIYRGRLYLAVGNIVWYSEPLAYGWFRPEKGYLAFPSEVLHVFPVTGGLYVVCVDQVLYLQGSDPAEFQQIFVGQYAAVYGTLVDVRAQGVGQTKWILTTDKGVVYFGEGGQVQNVTQNRLNLPRAQTGGGVFRDYNGQQHYVATMRNPASGMAFSESMTVEIKRNGLPIKE